MNIPLMRATNVTSLRNHMKQYFDEVQEKDKALIITRSDDQNAVLISEDSFYEMIQEINNLNYIVKLLQSKSQAEQGELVTFSMDDLDNIIE